MSTNLRFLSANQFKIAEVQQILAGTEVTVLPIAERIEELQTNDTQRLVRDKLLRAYDIVGRPLFVEHTGLYLDFMNGFPGGLTQVFWDSLQADKFAELFGSSPRNSVTARTTIALTFGRDIEIFEGEISGIVAESPRGDRSFQWDCVFQPDGESRTFAEMGEEKNAVSMRRRAFDKLAAYLASNPR